MAATLGAYTVLTMQPRPQKAQEGVVLESRAGVAGHAAWKTGARGEPHSVETLVDVSTYANACTLCATYEALVSSVVAVTIGGQALGNFLITHVQAHPERIVLGCGGIGGTSRALVKATWNLVAWS